MTKIKLPTSTEVEVTEPMAFIGYKSQNYAYLIMPDGTIRITSRTFPIDAALVQYGHFPDARMENTPITEARFYEMVAENYHTHLAAMQATAKAWGLTIQPLEVS